MARPAPRRAAAVAALLLAPLAPAWALGVAGDPKDGAATIDADDVAAHLRALASAPLEGRDSPSLGLERAADYVSERLRAAGLRGAGPDGSFRLPFTRTYSAPVPERCALVLAREGEEPVELAFGRDFVPLPVCVGEGEGRPVFVGFGIASDRERYDDLRGADLEGNVAVLVDGEPRHRRRFEGEDEVTPDADVHLKVAALVEAGAVGALVVRRPPPPEADGVDEDPAFEDARLGYRYTWATWHPSTRQRDPQVPRYVEVPVLEVTPEAASRVLGEDVLALAERIDRTGKPLRSAPVDAVVRLRSAIDDRPVEIDNVVGILPGTDPALADEYVVVGAHYDHVGVDVRGRVGFGADDNASGTSAMLEIVEALAAAGPRRSVLACAFAAEEDGMVGSAALVDAPPVPREAMVAMLNLDMVGRGERDEVVVLGTDQSPDLEDVLARARKDAGVRVKVRTGVARHLWGRSDHISFHRAGVPTLFFFESPSELDNPDYHTWRDTVDLVDPEKVARTAHLAFHTAWLLAEADERPAPPRD